jgi:hypothetical protein
MLMLLADAPLSRKNGSEADKPPLLSKSDLDHATCVEVALAVLVYGNCDI